MIDARRRTVAIFQNAEDVRLVDEAGVIDGGDVLPGWQVDLARLFAELDRKAPEQ